MTARGLILPMAVVLAPQIALAATQHGMAVLAPAFTAAAGLPPEAVGIVGGLSGLGSLWFFAASGAVLPVLGAVRAMLWSCLLAVGAATLLALGTAPTIFAGALLVGFAYAATAPAGSQILAEHTPQRLWGTLFSVRMAGVPAGGAIAGLLGAGLAAAPAWQAGVAAVAALPLTCAAFLALAPAPFRPAPRTGRLRPAAIASPRNLMQPFRVVRGRPELIRLATASLGFAAVQGASFTFLTTYLTDGLGLEFAVAGALYAVMQVASFAGRVAIGVLADRLGSPRGVLIALAFASAGGAVLLASASAELHTGVLVAAAAVVGMSVATWNGLFLAEVAAAGRTAVAEATSAVTFFTFAAYMVTPPVFAGLAYLAGYRPAYLAVAGCALVSAALLIRAPRGAES